MAEPASDPLLCLPTEPIDTVSVRQMVEALTDRFDDHHGEIARILLSQMNCLTVQIDAHTTRIKQLVAAISTAGACAPTALPVGLPSISQRPILGSEIVLSL